LGSDPAVGVLWHLLCRCAEMARGAIVAFATVSGSATEVLSRATIERAIVVQFIVQDPRPRLAAYLRHHVDDVDRQIGQWHGVAKSLFGEDRVTHLAAAEQRALANQGMRTLVNRLENELLGEGDREKWPSRIADLFEAVQDGVTYRTVYARLCSEIHFD